MKILFAALTFACASGLATGQSLLFTLSNDDPLGSYSDARIHSAGDVNADGWPDIVIGGAAHVRVSSGKDQLPLYNFTDGLVSGAHPSFIPVGAGAGDINLDGHDDIVVGVGADAAAGGPVGAARLYSGKDGSVLHLWLGAPGSNLGADVAGPGDVNGDGRPDVLAARPGSGDPGSPLDSAFVYSGLDGSTLYHIEDEPPSLPAETGNLVRVSGAGDANADGFADVAVAIVPSPWFSSDAARVRVLSGSDGALIHDLTDHSVSSAGDGLAPAGDIDGDGHDDLLIGVPFAHLDAHFSGYVEAVSGKTGERIVIRQGIATWGFFGHGLDSAGDVDGDGFPDFVVGEHLASTKTTYQCGLAHVYVDGGARQLDSVLQGATTGALFGTQVAGVGDANQDGFDDVAALDPYATGLSAGTGKAMVFSVAGCGEKPHMFVPGSELRGEILEHGDKDSAMFHAVYGSRLKVTVEVLSGDLIPRIEIIDPDNEIVASWKVKGGGPKKLKVKLSANGSHRLRIQATQGTLGSYHIKTKIKLPPKSAALKKVMRKGKGAENPPEVSFRAPKGTILEVVVKPRKGLPVHPAVELISPKGKPLDVLPFIHFATLSDDTEIRQMLLPKSGKYLLRVAEPVENDTRTKAEFSVEPHIPIGAELREID